MNVHDNTSGVRALGRGIRNALQWRLLLLWALILLLPTAIVALPLWSQLGELLDHSIYASAWAQQMSGLAATDVFVQIGRSDTALSTTSNVAMLLALLLSPLLTGMVIASGRAGRTLGFGGLLQGGIHEYGRMLRSLLWAILPLGIAFAVGAGALALADKRADEAILQSTADTWSLIAWIVFGVVFVIAHASVEAGRAQFIADPALRSAIRGWWRGFRQLLRRPLSTLGIYLAVSVIGYVLVLLLTMLRIRMDGDDLLMFTLAFLVTQLGVMVLAWMRSARLFGLAAVANGNRATASSSSWAV